MLAANQLLLLSDEYSCTSDAVNKEQAAHHVWQAVYATLSMPLGSHRKHVILAKRMFENLVDG